MISESSNNAELPGALSSLNIGGGKINIKEKEATDNINTATILCAACGKEGGDNMNACNTCDLVVYCNASCKKKHRSKHKKKCEKRIAELYDIELFREPLPPEECPICMLPPLIHANHTGMTFQSCCGKRICDGCIYTMIMEEIRRGKKKEEINACAFCRTLRPSSDEEEVKRLKKLMEKGNGDAFNQLAGYYRKGMTGMPQNRAKANELYLKAGELRCAVAYYNLGNSYYNGHGVEVDKKKAKHYYELAAINGSVQARHNLGVDEYEAGNYHRAFKHFIFAASAGYKPSLDNVKQGYTAGHIRKDEYANTLREYQKSQDELKSDARDKARAQQLLF